MRGGVILQRFSERDCCYTPGDQRRGTEGGQKKKGTGSRGDFKRKMRGITTAEDSVTGSIRKEYIEPQKGEMKRTGELYHHECSRGR